MTTMSIIKQPDAEERSEHLILDKKGTEDRDPLDEN